MPTEAVTGQIDFFARSQDCRTRGLSSINADTRHECLPELSEP